MSGVAHGSVLRLELSLAYISELPPVFQPLCLAYADVKSWCSLNRGRQGDSVMRCPSGILYSHHRATCSNVHTCQSADGNPERFTILARIHSRKLQVNENLGSWFRQIRGTCVSRMHAGFKKSFYPSVHQ